MGETKKAIPFCCVIAEVGVNHDGSVAKAHKLIEEGAKAGADVIKFQTFVAKDIATKHAAKAQYQLETSGSKESQLEMLENLMLSKTDYQELVEHCYDLQVDFLSTPFDFESLDFLVNLGVNKIKIGSGDMNNAPLLLAVAQTNLPIILSTGMSTLGEIEEALGVLAFGCSRSGHKPSKKGFFEAWQDPSARSALENRVTLLHCTSQYPAPIADVNLRVMESLRNAFGLEIGYSDHTAGISISIAAAALGASVIEKHITLDSSLPGPDHAASLEPTEFKNMVEGIRETCVALGSSNKTITASEINTREVARKSLVAATEIEKGAVISADKIGVKRPAKGRDPIDYWEVLGTTASNKFAKDELL